MRVLVVIVVIVIVVIVIVVIVIVVIVTWESKANSSSSLTELQTGTELGNYLSLAFTYKHIDLEQIEDYKQDREGLKKIRDNS